MAHLLPYHLVAATRVNGTIVTPHMKLSNTDFQAAQK